ncbi:MAG TPA: hypothetical protein PLE35_09365 [Lentisphaeria bacterium]|nr:hypothetical protein [Lentisphaeria bacterium]
MSFFITASRAVAADDWRGWRRRGGVAAWRRGGVAAWRRGGVAVPSRSSRVQ